MSGRGVNGEGSVFQRKDGRWVAAAYVLATDGRYRRVALYADSRAKAKVRLRELVDRTSRNVPAVPTALTVAKYLDEWLVHIKQHVRPSTWKAYEANTRLHIVPRIGRKKLGQLSVRDVRLMVDSMRTDGAGQRTIQYAHATLRAALEHAYREELVARNVAKLVRIERPTQTRKEPLSVAEARQLLEATIDDQNYALWVVVLMLGLRRSEVCGLRWVDVDLVERTLRITQTVQRFDGRLQELPTKTRRSTRTIPLPPRVLTALTERQHAAESHSQVGTGTYVFGTRNGTPLEPRNLTRMWSELCEREGIRKVPLHGLRHTCVSLLLGQGVHPRTVMEIAGHSAIEMTMNVYGHVNLETQRKALDDLDRALS